MIYREQHSLQWHHFINGTNETIPGFSCIRISGSRRLNNETVPVGLKPNDYGAQFYHRITGPEPVEPGKTGMCALPYSAPVIAKCEGTSGLGGPTSDSFELTQGVGGFRILGAPYRPIFSGMVLVVFEPLLSATAVLNESLGNAASAEAAIGENTLTVHEVLGGLSEDIASDTKVRIQWDSALPGWVVIASAC